MMSDKRRFWNGIVAWAMVVAYMMIIFTLSAQSKLPSPPSFLGWDKFQHYLAYMFMGLLIFRAAYRAPALPIGPYWHALILGALYGGLDEFHQSFVPGRNMSILDWLADVAGLIMALAIVYIARRYRPNGGK